MSIQSFRRYIGLHEPNTSNWAHTLKMPKTRVTPKNSLYPQKPPQNLDYPHFKPFSSLYSSSSYSQILQNGKLETEEKEIYQAHTHHPIYLVRVIQ
jgi:hypothetical protein